MCSRFAQILPPVSHSAGSNAERRRHARWMIQPGHLAPSSCPSVRSRCPTRADDVRVHWGLEFEPSCSMTGHAVLTCETRRHRHDLSPCSTSRSIARRFGTQNGCGHRVLQCGGVGAAFECAVPRWHGRAADRAHGARNIGDRVGKLMVKLVKSVVRPRFRTREPPASDPRSPRPRTRLVQLRYD